MKLRPSSLALAAAIAIAAAGGLVVVDESRLQVAGAAARAERAARVSELGLTDFAWFTEARYTRHWSLADRHSAFQDHPFALEHFPAGSLLSPPKSWQ